MSMLDVSDALTDPYTQDIFIVHRRTQIVDNYGESKISIEKIPLVRGVVFPEGLNDLARRPEAQINAKTLVFITRFALRGESKDSNTNSQYHPDLVEWRTNLFLVVRVEDWSNFARGFVRATCTSINSVDQATGPKPLTPQNVTVTG